MSTTTINAYLNQFAAPRRITLIGPLLPHPLPAPLPQEPLLWIDGGIEHRPSGTPNLGFSIGDGDSTNTPLNQYLSPTKDYSDLAYTLRQLPPSVTEVTLLGFLGGRRDHELFNLGETHHFLAQTQTPTCAHFDHHIHAYSKGKWQFTAHHIFSLAVLAPTTIQLTGACQYPLPHPTQLTPLISLGLSNRGFGTITLTTDNPAFILQETNHAESS